MNEPAVKPAGQTASDPASRRLARLAAVQGLYRLALSDETADELIREFRRDPHALLNDVGGGDAPVATAQVDVSLFASIVGGVPAAAPELDEMIAGAMDGKLSAARLELLLRAILRAGVYELRHHTDTVPGIVINDYVDIAHAFFNAKEPGLVNALLDRIGKQLRAI